MEKNKMIAALMYGPNDIRIEEVPIPTCPTGGFVLKVKAVGLCGSDIRNLTTDSRNGDYPFIYGHEIVGEIVEIDATVDKYQVGQIVYVYPMAHCLECENCRAGHGELCEHVEQYTQRPGGFAQYIAYTDKRVKRGGIYEIPKGQDLVAATLAEPMSSTYACVENINVTLGDTVCIVGAGPIGVFLTILSKLRGADKVIVIDLNANRLELIKQFKADYVINATQEDVIEKVKLYTNGQGADKVITCNPSVKSQEQSVYLAKKGGTIVFFGGVPKDSLAQINTNVIHYNNLWIYGQYAANSVQVEKAFHLALHPKFPAKQIITHVLPLRQINQGLELVKSGEALKVVLLPEEDACLNS